MPSDSNFINLTVNIKASIFKNFLEFRRPSGRFTGTYVTFIGTDMMNRN